MFLCLLNGFGKDVNNIKCNFGYYAYYSYFEAVNVPATSEVRASAMFITDHTKLKRVSFG
jgi:hypothetical protein